MKWLLSTIALSTLVLSGNALADHRYDRFDRFDSFKRTSISVQVPAFQPVTHKRRYYNNRYSFDRSFDRYDRRFDRKRGFERKRRFDRRDRFNRFDRFDRKGKRRGSRNRRYCD